MIKPKVKQMQKKQMPIIGKEMPYKNSECIMNPQKPTLKQLRLNQQMLRHIMAKVNFKIYQKDLFYIYQVYMIKLQSNTQKLLKLIHNFLCLITIEAIINNYNIGLIYYILLQYDRAVEEYSKAISIDPQDFISYYNRAIAYHYLKNYDEAIKGFSYVIQINPNYAMAYFNRGNTYLELDLIDDAIEDFNTAIKMDPQITLPKNLEKIAQTNNIYSEALGYFQKAIEQNPQHAKAYNNKGFVQQHLKKYDDAIKDFSDAIKIDPKLATAYNNRGNVYYHLKKYPEAIQDYSSAIKIDPKYVKAYNNRGNAYIKLNRVDDCNKDYELANKIDPEYKNNKWNVQYDLSMFNMPKQFDCEFYYYYQKNKFRKIQMQLGQTHQQQQPINQKDQLVVC
ncbi:unnamed protein product [Paramecium primaurelia]|uniref:Tetratricopeptide repeat protein n=1 Tax=Paramecium primaurelia TaxID=5886 RepID=A0A8S1PSD6_PARPR|nr:unnamed protein product [Paramecium primaurelia]